MAKTEENIRKSEEFIRKVLQENFGQSVTADRLREAAEKLCEAIPQGRVAA
jgi:hypothetical protein